VHALQQFLLATWRDGMRAADDLDELWLAELRTVIIDMLALALKGARCERPARTLPRADHLLAIVEARLQDPDLSAAGLAADLNVSVRTVQLWFAALGKSPRAYILERRMLRAAERLLVAPFEHVTTIALDIGFNDSAYFTRCFTRHFGCSPSRWRETGGRAAVSR
jgi:AraC-like DNA-binding protein